MFKNNEGTVDRALRVIVGLALVIWFFADQGTGFWHYAKLLGFVAIITGLIGYCPAYSILGFSTRETKKP